MEQKRPSKGQYIASIILNSIALILVAVLFCVIVFSLIGVVKDKAALGPDDKDNTGLAFGAIVLFLLGAGSIFMLGGATLLNVIACIVLRCKRDRKWDFYSILTVVLVFMPAAAWGILYGICQYVSMILNGM